MAKKHPNETAIGIVVLVVLALAVYIVVALGDWENLFTTKQQITVRLPQKVGLKQLTVGSPIFLGGVKIGQIIDAGIEKPPPNEAAAHEIFVFFTMKIPDRYKLYTDCELTAASNVLGGQASLVIQDLGRDGQPIKDGHTVDLSLQGGITEAMDNLKEQFNPDDPNSLVAKIDITLDRFGDITQAVKLQLDETNELTLLARLHAALAKLNSGLTEIEDLIKTNKTPVTETIASARKVAQDLERDMPEMTKRIESALTNANDAMAAAKVALADADELIKTTKEMILVNRPTVDDLVRNFQEVSINLKMASRQIRRAPWKLVYKPKKDELHIQGIIDSAGDFAAAAERLDNASLQLRAMVEHAGPTDMNTEDIRKMIAELETTFERFRVAQERFWQELK